LEQIAATAIAVALGVDRRLDRADRATKGKHVECRDAYAVCGDWGPFLTVSVTL
jgi:hypothetical protein